MIYFPYDFKTEYRFLGRGAVFMINTNEKYPLPCEREHCRGYTVRILPCKPVLQIISAGLSLRWRASAGLDFIICRSDGCHRDFFVFELNYFSGGE